MKLVKDKEIGDIPVIRVGEGLRGLVVRGAHRPKIVYLELTQSLLVAVFNDKNRTEKFYQWLQEEVYPSLLEDDKSIPLASAFLEEFNKRPPHGIMPKNLWQEQRFYDLWEAMVRKQEANPPLAIPEEWKDEFIELLSKIKLHKGKPV